MQKTITLLVAGMLLAPAIGFARSGTVTGKVLPPGLRQEPVRMQADIRDIKASDLLFIENNGQITDQFGNPRHDIRFHVTGNGMDVYISNGKIGYQFNNPLPATYDEEGNMVEQKVATYNMDLTLLGANPNAKVRTEDPDFFYERHYTATSGPDGILVRSYRKVVFEEVYPNIDWVIYSKGRNLEYDFVVKPGGKISDIRMKYDGATSLKLNDDGSLTAVTPMGTVTEQAPYSFTATDNKKVNSSFVLHDGVLGFRTAAYKGTLVIDPVLSWATYYGGAGTDYVASHVSDHQNTVAIDDSCNVYLIIASTGSSSARSTGLGTPGVYQDTMTGSSGMILVKFNSAGVRQWATYYPTFGYGVVATDKKGGVFISWPTNNSATYLTTPGTYMQIHPASYSVLLVKFNQDGQREWGTFFGGNMRDYVDGIACDHDGNLIMGGYTGGLTGGNVGGSWTLATPGAYRTDTIGKQDGYIAKFNGKAGTLMWSTYFGGNEQDQVMAVTVDESNNIYATGRTNSAGLALGNTTNIQGAQDGFIAKFAPNGTPSWIRYFGGEGVDNGKAIKYDGFGHLFVTGLTNSTTGVATPGTYQQTPGPMFVSKFDTAGGNQIWGTYALGRYGKAYVLDTDPLGRVWVGAHTQPDTPYTIYVTPGSHKDTTVRLNTEGWIAQFDSSGQNMLYGTFFGSSAEERILGIVTDKSGGVYFAGASSGTSEIATPGAHQENNGGGTDGFIGKLTDCSVISGSAIAADGPITFCQGESVNLEVTTPGILSCVSYQWQLNGTNIAQSNTPTYVARVSGDYTVIVSNSDGECRDTSMEAVSITVHPLPTPQITADGEVLTADSNASYQWYRNNASIPGATDRSYEVTRDGNYKVTVTDENGCVGTSDGIDMTGVTNVSLLYRDDIRIFPNPAGQMLYVDAPENVSITITSIEGRVVATFKDVKVADIGFIADGMYIVRVTDSNQTLLLVEKLIKGSQ